MIIKMQEWHIQIQSLIDEIDKSIKSGDDSPLVLSRLAAAAGYSEYYFSRRFREISGMRLKDFLRLRRLAFALCELRDTDSGILDIAVKYGFSSHEAFTRAFKAVYGVTPSAYRKNPRPAALHTVIKPLDCYLSDMGVKITKNNISDVKTYFVTIPAHKFLHIRNYESIGYWDFWQKQSLIPGQDCETVCRLLDKIEGKLDDMGGNEANSGSGQIMGYINTPEGRICSWGIPLAECYGVRLPADYDGEVPSQMILTDIPQGEYIVFEHGAFDYEKENQIVEAKIEAAMKAFDWDASGYRLDTAPGRIFYFYHDPSRYWKYIRPVCRL